MIYTRYRGIKIATQKSGSFVSFIHGHMIFAPSLAGMVSMINKLA